MSSCPPGEEVHSPGESWPRAAPVIERAPLPMVEVEGPNHVVASVNAAFCRLLQKKAGELVGRPFSEIVPHGDRCVSLLDRIYQTGEFEMQVEPDDSGPDPAHWLFAMWPALGKDRKPERVVIQLTRSHFHQNIREMNQALMLAALKQHQMREAAEKSSARLEMEVVKRKSAGDAMRRAIDQLTAAQTASERGNRAKDNFLAALSHELRTPLTPALLTAASLREDSRLPAEVREQLGVIVRNIGVEARLIDDLLDVTKIAQGKLEFRPEFCDAHPLIQFAIDIVRGDAAAKDIELVCSLQAQYSGLTADPTRFQQVIWNLLRNAVKFTPVGGKVSVRTLNQVSPDEVRWLRIEVSDTGIGIPPEQLEEIFLPFNQGGLGGDHRFGGVGLGLAIARSIVDLHEGTIGAQSDGPNRGTTFVVELPRATLAAPQLAGGANAASTALPSVPGLKDSRAVGALRLLVVEDHASTREALRYLLQKDGYRVTTAGTMAAARAAADGTTFDLVISDLGLPDGSGIDLMREMRTTHGLRGIALSGYGMNEDIARSRDAGFVAHLIKPVGMAELRRVLASLGPAETRRGELPA
ncbi:MAG TPA: ATP-binding protein [Opitutus sp.]|nr:ATP-binding protein [Opitutus sp.]